MTSAPSFTFDQWVGIAGFIGTSIGIVLSVVFYRRSVQEPIPTYGVHPLRLRLVDKTRMKVSALEVSHNGYPLGSANVTATTVFFWNNGRLPIRKSDVLKPFEIELDGNSEILDVDLVKKTRDECGFHINSVHPISSVNGFSLTFDVVEQGDGVAIQIIHTGNPEGEVSMTGASVGAKALKRVRPTDLVDSSKDLVALNIQTVTVTLFLWYFVIDHYRSGTKSVSEMLGWWCFMALGLLSLALAARIVGNSLGKRKSAILKLMRK